MKYFLIAGEASGDLHGSALMQELKAIDNQAEFCFLGGDLMTGQGGKLVRHINQMAFMGIVNVLLNLKKIAANAKSCKQAILKFKPDIVILIDYPGFNLQVAKFVKKNLQSAVYYYIAPKLWAWKSYRIKNIKKYVDKMLTIFPFETEYFAQFNYNVNYVGNPTVDAIENFLQNNKNESIESEKPIVALLAGSRKQEIHGCLKIMSSMANFFPDFKFVLAAAPAISEDFYRKILPKNIEIVFSQTYNVLKNAYVAVVNSGTATLETALLNTPQVVVYHVTGGIFVPILRKMLIHVPFVSLVNLIGKKEVVKELITPTFTEKKLKFELAKILYNNDLRNNIFSDYQKIRETLGEKGTAKRAAKLIFENILQKNI
jgi:lipid-A-disaccharide synthase